MSHTNSTANYQLPQFLPTDKPAWLVDVNGAFTAIDAQMKSNQTTAETASANASQALSEATTASAAATAATNTANGAIASLANAFETTSTYTKGDIVIYNSLLYICTVNVTVPGSWTGSANWSRITVENSIVKIPQIEDDIAALKNPTVDSFVINTESVVTAGYITGYKSGRLVVISANATLSGLSSGATVLGNIPVASNHPIINVYCEGAYGSSSAAGTTVRLNVNTNGIITVYAPTGVTGANGIRFTMVYFTAE